MSDDNPQEPELVEEQVVEPVEEPTEEVEKPVEKPEDGESCESRRRANERINIFLQDVLQNFGGLALGCNETYY